MTGGEVKYGENLVHPFAHYPLQ